MTIHGEKPTVSIYVPCYNVENYIEKAVDSIRKQTYTHIEMILINNMSGDNTLEVLNKLAKEDGRIKVYSREIKGLAATRNFALTVCNGDWIFPVDADDAVVENAVEILLKAALEHEADLVCASHYITGEKVLSKERPVHLKEIESTDKGELHEFFLKEGREFNQTWGKLYKKSVLEDIKYPEGKLYEDLAVMPDLIENASKIVTLDVPVYFYVQSHHSISSKASLLRQKDGFDLRIKNCGFYENRYPEIVPDAYDAALEFSFYLLGKISASGIKHNRELWDEMVLSTKEVIKKAARKGTAMKIAVMMFAISPKIAGSFFALYSKVKNRIKE